MSTHAKDAGLATEVPAVTAVSLKWLACPVCHGGLELAEGGIRCTVCARSFKIADGLPRLLPDL